MLAITGQVRVNPFTSSQVRPIAAIGENLASTEGPLDLFCWFEGANGLKQQGANWMKRNLFQPIFEAKRDLRLKLYSLGAWRENRDFTLRASPDTTPLGESIRRIENVAFECIYSLAFFRFCIEERENSDLYAYISNIILTKGWLQRVSRDEDDVGKTVLAHMDHQPSLLDGINAMDFAKAYALMQYLEGYFLIRESVKKAVARGENEVEIAFVLCRGEEIYYTYDDDNFAEFRTDIENMLQRERDAALRSVHVTFSFQFWRYNDNPKARPYNQVQGKNFEKIGSYFSFLQGGN